MLKKPSDSFSFSHLEIILLNQKQFSYGVEMKVYGLCWGKVLTVFVGVAMATSNSKMVHHPSRSKVEPNSGFSANMYSMIPLFTAYLLWKL